MKTLHLSIITIVGIVVIAMTTLGVFIEKLNDNQQQPYTGMMITGVKENYALNEPIAFSIIIEGYGSGCGDTKAIITKENDSQYKSSGWNSMAQCASNAKPSYFKFNALSGNTSINQAGNYTITASFDNLITYRHTTAEQKFTVLPSLDNNQTLETVNNESKNDVFPVKIDKLYVASFGNELKNTTSIKVGNLYSATVEVTRLKGNFDSDNDWYVLLIQVKNATGVSQATSWHEGQIPVGKSSSGGVYWRPDAPGNYSVEAFVWQSLEGTPLAQNRQINVQVLPAG